jgi:hypothetical protein
MSTSYTETSAVPQNNLTVAIYSSLANAETAVKELCQSGFDMEKLSILDRRSGSGCDRWGHQTTGFYNFGIPIICLRRYETALKVDKFILLAQWAVTDVGSGSEVVSHTHPELVEVHQFSASRSLN